MTLRFKPRLRQDGRAGARVVSGPLITLSDAPHYLVALFCRSAYEAGLVQVLVHRDYLWRVTRLSVVLGSFYALLNVLDQFSALGAAPGCSERRNFYDSHLCHILPLSACH